MHRASRAQVVTECIAERLKTQRVDIVDRMQPRLPAVVGNEPRPDFKRKMVESGLMNSKGSPSVPPRGHFEGGKER